MQGREVSCLLVVNSYSWHDETLTGKASWHGTLFLSFLSSKEGVGMIPESLSRHGLTPDERREDSSGRTAHRSSGSKWLRCVGISLILSLVLLMDVLSNMPVAAAASHAPTKLPVPKANFTLQQFLKQGHPYQAKDAPLISSQGTPSAPRGTTLPKQANQSLPSAQPPTMKAASQQISASFLQAPLVPASLDPTITGNAGSTPSLRVVGSDTNGVRLEVIIVPGSLDLSKATTAKGTTPPPCPRSPLRSKVAARFGIRSMVWQESVIA
jgi:hypothetical protein